MALAKRYCSLCKHETRQMVGCGRIACELAESTGVEGIHEHCDQDNIPAELARADDHPLCTPRGCRGAAERLPLVNPDLTTGEVPE